MKKLLTCLLLLVLMAGILSGCWSRKELQELAIVLGAGVDRTPDGQVQLTLQLSRPSVMPAGPQGGLSERRRLPGRFREQVKQFLTLREG